MRRLRVAVLLLVSASGAAFSQTRREPVGWISFFSGGGAISGAGPTVDYIGDESTFRIYKGLGAGLGESSGWDFGGGGPFVLFPVNLSYHFNRQNKLGPFVTGGYSIVFRKGTREDGGNFGAGLKYWFSDHIRLDAELRNHIFTGAGRNFFEVRVGVAMR